MKITYIHHSCFLAETETAYYIFDYFKGNLPVLNPEKPIIVFSSHSHPDHYSADIFSLLKERGMKEIYAVLSDDIPSKLYPSDISVTAVSSHQTHALSYDTTLETLFSTDQGVAFLLTCPYGTIYHGGDLNDWVWEGETSAYNKNMTETYQKEIKKIEGREIDIAFLVLDPRQEKDYARGITYFLEHTKTKKVFPMHYWEQPEIIQKFQSEYPEFSSVIENTENYCVK